MEITGMKTAIQEKATQNTAIVSQECTLAPEKGTWYSGTFNKYQVNTRYEPELYPEHGAH